MGSESDAMLQKSDEDAPGAVRRDDCSTMETASGRIFESSPIPPPPRTAVVRPLAAKETASGRIFESSLVPPPPRTAVMSPLAVKTKTEKKVVS